jgi:hypothetical protein
VDYTNDTLLSIFTLLMRDGQSQDQGIDFIQFFTLIKAFDHIKKRKAEEIFLKYCNEKQKIDFVSIKKLSQSQGLLSPSSYLRFASQKVF